MSFGVVSLNRHSGEMKGSSSLVFEYPFSCLIDYFHNYFLKKFFISQPGILTSLSAGKFGNEVLIPGLETGKNAV